MDIVPHNKVVADEADVAAVAELVRSGQWATGAMVAALEAQLALVCGRSHAVVVASGLSALRLSLMALDVRAGDQVGIPGYSCVALADAVLSLGAAPVAVDCDPQSLTLSASAVSASHRARLSCLIAVDTFGVAADVQTLGELGLPVIEDCAHGFAHGQLGRQGTLAVISLHATKFIGAGKGGAVLTDDAALAGRLRDLREYDDRPPSPQRLNDRLDDINAALALSRLARLPQMVATRRQIAERYQRAFELAARAGSIGLPADSQERVWYRYAIRTDDAAGWIRRLHENGIECVEPVWNWLDEEQLASCPIAAQAFRSIVSLPMFPALTEEQQDRVIRAVGAAAGG